MDIQSYLLAIYKGHELTVSSDKVYRVYRHTGNTSVLMNTAKELLLFDDEFHQNCVVLESIENEGYPIWEIYLARHGRMYYMNALYDEGTEELILCMYTFNDKKRKEPYTGNEFNVIKRILIRYIVDLPVFRLRGVTGCLKITDVMKRKNWVYEGE